MYYKFNQFIELLMNEVKKIPDGYHSITPMLIVKNNGTKGD